MCRGVEVFEVFHSLSIHPSICPSLHPFVYLHICLVCNVIEFQHGGMQLSVFIITI